MGKGGGLGSEPAAVRLAQSWQKAGGKLAAISGKRARGLARVLLNWFKGYRPRMLKKQKMVKTLTKQTVTVKTLTKNLKKLKLNFDRAAYRKAYDKVYFKQIGVCPWCGQTKTKHMMRRHQATAKCKRLRQLRKSKTG